MRLLAPCLKEMSQNPGRFDHRETEGTEGEKGREN